MCALHAVNTQRQKKPLTTVPTVHQTPCFFFPREGEKIRKKIESSRCQMFSIGISSRFFIRGRTPSHWTHCVETNPPSRTSGTLLRRCRRCRSCYRQLEWNAQQAAVGVCLPASTFSWRGASVVHHRCWWTETTADAAEALEGVSATHLPSRPRPPSLRLRPCEQRPCVPASD